LAIFHSPTDEVLYYVVYLAWIATFFVERLIISSGGERATKRQADDGSVLIIVLSIFGAIIIATWFAGLGIARLPHPWFYVGLTMMVLGIGLRVWAVATLRSFFSYIVRIKEGHRVVREGPYRYIRHPAYAGSLLTILGVGFALQTWGGVLAMGIIFGFAFGYRISVEERALVSALGEEYAAYARSTKRLIPYVF
jgi:protein-S-isoprenylcysteine O-methyltransferase Ste14